MYENIRIFIINEEQKANLADKERMIKAIKEDIKRCLGRDLWTTQKSNILYSLLQVVQKIKIVNLYKLCVSHLEQNARPVAI